MAGVSNFELVGDFMEAFGQDVHCEPIWPDFSTRELRLDLIQEEFEELQEAIDNKDMVEVADALTDLLYVVYGACLLYTSPSPRDGLLSRMPSSA